MRWRQGRLGVTWRRCWRSIGIAWRPTVATFALTVIRITVKLPCAIAIVACYWAGLVACSRRWTHRGWSRSCGTCWPWISTIALAIILVAVELLSASAVVARDRTALIACACSWWCCICKSPATRSRPTRSTLAVVLIAVELLSAKSIQATDWAILSTRGSWDWCWGTKLIAICSWVSVLALAIVLVAVELSCAGPICTWYRTSLICRGWLICICWSWCTVTRRPCESRITLAIVLITIELLCTLATHTSHRAVLIHTACVGRSRGTCCWLAVAWRSSKSRSTLTVVLIAIELLCAVAILTSHWTVCTYDELQTQCNNCRSASLPERAIFKSSTRVLDSLHCCLLYQSLEMEAF